MDDNYLHNSIMKYCELAANLFLRKQIKKIKRQMNKLRSIED